ncbi:MAG TPA: GH3 auxin-responsive promoter family protein [Phycisphaerae bacterium]|nr:GH3 auxin-responsive promoter family protein [Phycisphaerae bacterium]
MKTPVGIHLRRLLWTPLRVQAKTHVRRWRKAVEKTPETQSALLARLLADAAETDFGRDHGLQPVRTVEDLRKAMPVAGYERAEPYIDRVARGETGALFPAGTRIHMFAMTSGTTGTPKRIPVTDTVLRDCRYGWHVWGTRALDDHFDAFGAKILQIASRMDEEITPGGIPAGAMSGLICQVQSPTIRRLYVMPPEAAFAEDTQTKYYLACRLGLMSRRVLPVTANPSTLLGLARAMDAHKDALLRDLSDGVLSLDLALDEEKRRAIEARLKPMPDRARELEAGVRDTGHLYPKDAWELPLIGTWKGGTLCLYLRELPRYWGDAPVRDIGLLASEGRFSIPLRTDGSAGVLEATATFYEFVPEDEIDRADPQALLAHEVEVGRRYFLILTTAGGLFRYNIGDLVRVTDRMGPAPVIEFLNKGEHVANLTGEKLTEHQVTTAVNESVAHLGLDVCNYCLCPTWADVPHYSLLAEACDVSADRAEELACAVDSALQELNMEYRAKRASGRLAPVCIKTIPPGAWRAYDRRAIQERRGRVEQYKHKFLVNEVDFERRFTVLASYH